MSGTFLGIRLISLVGFILFLAYGCNFSRPAVNNNSWNAPKFDHSNFTTSCSPCHEAERPKPVYQTPHGNGLDCATCHKYTSDKSWLSHLQYSHIPDPTSCLACHGSLRPAPPHIQSGDCVSCHHFPSWSPINQ